MASIDSLYRLLAVELPGCPEPSINVALNRAAIEFCAKSMVWRDTMDPVTLRAGVGDYDVDLPVGASLVVLRDVRLGGKPLSPIVDSRRVSGLGTATGQPLGYAQPSHDTIRVHPIPTESGAVLTAEMVLKPAFGATTIPDILADRYFEAVAYGAKALLKRIPRQAWSDPQGAALDDALFRQKTDEARIEMEHGRVLSSITLQPRAYGGR